MGKYFGTDGFRGEVGAELTAEHAYRIGRFLGWAYSNGGSRQVKTVIGKDTRRSGYALEYALASGLAASGADCYLLHVIPTPGVSYAVAAGGFDCGVMITASHNPFWDNGIKPVNGRGEKMDEEMIACIEAYLDGDLAAAGLSREIPYAKGEAMGRIVDYAEGRTRYAEHLISACRHSLRPYRVGLDCANGSAWMLAGQVLERLGAQVSVIHASPDGTNINRGAGSTHIETLSAHVRRQGLDVGFAFDGDADRCIAVDERGEVVNGDHLLYLLSRNMKWHGELEGNTVVATVMSNLGLLRALEAEGIAYEQTAVGDRFVYERMKEKGYCIGGEQSGHLILRRYATTGDGILTAIKVMEVMLEEGTPLSRLAAPMRMLPQVLINLPVTDKGAATSDEGVQRVLEEARGRLGNNGRILLRESGTEPVVRVMAEADSEALCRRCAEDVAKVIRENYGREAHA